MSCANYLEKSSTFVESGDWGNAGVVVLHTSGVAPDEDSRGQFDERLHIDPATWLPVASVSLVQYTDDMSYSITTDYDTRWLDRSSLADDFFDPVGKSATPTDTPSLRHGWAGSALTMEQIHEGLPDAKTMVAFQDRAGHDLREPCVPAYG